MTRAFPVLLLAGKKGSYLGAAQCRMGVRPDFMSSLLSEGRGGVTSMSPVLVESHAEGAGYITWVQPIAVWWPCRPSYPPIEGNGRGGLGFRLAEAWLG
jgi:hypothetical protein